MLFMFFSLFFVFFTNQTSNQELKPITRTQTKQPRSQTHHKNTNPTTKNSNHKNTNQELTHHKNTNPATKHSNHKSTNPATKNLNHKNTNQELTHHKNTNLATRNSNHKSTNLAPKNSNPYQKNTYTSSYSGRISILSQPIHQTQPNKKSKDSSWLFVSHDPTDPDSVISLLFPNSPTRFKPEPESELVLRFKPFIVVVVCKDLASAQLLVSTARSAGFRELDTTNVNNKHLIITIRCSIRLEVPLGTIEFVMVSPEFVQYLIRVANEKMEETEKERI